MPREKDWPGHPRTRHDRSAPVQQVSRANHKNPALGRSHLPSKSLPSGSEAASRSAQGEKRKPARSIWEPSNLTPPSKKARLDTEVFLDDLTSTMKTIIDDFQNDSHISKLSWFYRLKIQYDFIDELKGTSSKPSSILENPALALPFHPPDLSSSLVESHHKSHIRIAFERIEALRREILSRAMDHMEDDPRSPIIRLPFPGIIFLSLSFYHYALLRSHAPWCYIKLRGNNDFMGASQAASRLFALTRTTEDIESKRIDNLREILLSIIPNDSSHCWVAEPVTLGEREEILVYRRREGNRPLILATALTNEEEEDETLFPSIKRKYACIAAEVAAGVPQSECGVPVLFIQLTALYFLVGGAVCHPVTGLPIVRRLPGTVDLTEDFGYNVHEATYTIWSLVQCLNTLKKEVGMISQATRYSGEIEAPFVGLEGGGIAITASPCPGILYRVKLDLTKPVGRPEIEEKDHLATLKRHILSNMPINTSYVLKVTYPHMSRMPGAHVHRFLERHQFAPALYLEFSPPFDPSHYGLEDCESSLFIPLICYDVMEDLPPPTDTDTGFVTLHEFAEQAKANAILYKAGIQRTLHHIIKLLQANNMVHGDMRPNNIMVRVKVLNGTLCPQFRQDLNLIDMRIIDFDWAGEAGKVFYPAARNPRVTYWPGEDGGPISASHDEDMVRAWMKFWPA